MEEILILKVKCNDLNAYNLTFAKVYEVLDSWVEKSKMYPFELYDVYLVIDDTGNKSVEPCCIFSK
jgi:hypothetical protein